ncbi:hypothetical protein KSP40_PGU010771 [Platanthera guangdongensis]|uniref:Uncharacterized protein n=1 Tax=Platanthera guangdongensis TaxID=2320717 RepID=A0ABR2M776_9ASPA
MPLYSAIEWFHGRVMVLLSRKLMKISPIRKWHHSFCKLCFKLIKDWGSKPLRIIEEVPGEWIGNGRPPKSD